MNRNLDQPLEVMIGVAIVIETARRPIIAPHLEHPMYQM